MASDLWRKHCGNSKVLNDTTLANTAIYARLNQAPVKGALSKHADILLGSGYSSVKAPAAPVPLYVMPLNVMLCVLMPMPAPQASAWTPPRMEEREEWPG